MHHIFESIGVPTLMGGNIGLPILSQNPLPEGGVYVLELSSFQIDLTLTLDCDAAILLNITPDHLDRYDSYDAYAASKARLFDMLGSDHVAIFGSADEKTGLACKSLRELGRVRTIIDASQMELAGQSDWPSLQGPHNLENSPRSCGCGRGAGRYREPVASCSRNVQRSRSPQERIAEAEGVLFVNDSKATNAASTAPALGAYDRIHWIWAALPRAIILTNAKNISETSSPPTPLVRPHQCLSVCWRTRSRLSPAR